jgi:putative ABC transport system permease protein
MRLWRLLVRQWRSRPGRALATVASVAVAVGAVVATWVSADASRAGYTRITEAVEGLPTIDVSARGGGRFAANEVPRLVDVPGVKAVVPLFFRPTLLRVGEKRVREIAVGVDVDALVRAGLVTLVAGEPCREDDEVVLDAALAESLGCTVGDELLFFARRRIKRMRITGLVKAEDVRWFSEGAGVMVDIQVLGAMSLAAGQVDRVRVGLDRSAARSRVLTAISARLPEQLHAEVPAGRASMAEDVLHAANLGLDFVTWLTVAMAWFIVGNSMLMSVTERQRGFSLMRLLGATGGQVRGLVVREAAILGGLGAVLGAAAGLVAAGPISAGISQALQAPPSALVMHPAVVPVAVLLGTLIAVAAAWWPSRQATAVDLLEGLSKAPAPPPVGISWRFVAAVALLGGVAGSIELAVLGGWLPPRAAVPSGIVLMLAFVAASPLVLPLLVRWLSGLVPSRWRIERALAVEQILRQPMRTALTTGVLIVAVSNGIGLGHAIRDNVDDVVNWYGKMMRGDWLLTHAGMITAGSGTEGADLRTVEADVAALPGVARVDGLSIAAGRIAGGACVVVARDFPDDAPLPLEPVNATPGAVRAALQRGEVVIGTVLARRTGLEPGAETAVEVFGRTTTVTVAAHIVDYSSGGASLHLSRETARRLFGMEVADMFIIHAEPGRSAELAAPLATIAREHAMVLRSFGQVRRFMDGIVSGVVGSLWAILGLGFVVGSLGVANTVTMNVLEKRRALGLLRTVGMTRGQVTRMVVIESVLLGAAGGLIGMAGGLTTALFIQLASQPLLGHPVKIMLRPGVVAANLAAAVAVTAIAAWLPARRAAQLDLLESISAE